MKCLKVHIYVFLVVTARMMMPEYTFDEGNGPAVVCASLSAAAQIDVSVSLNTISGSATGMAIYPCHNVAVPYCSCSLIQLVLTSLKYHWLLSSHQEQL